MVDGPESETVEEQTIKRLVAGPSSKVTSQQGYDINIYLFYTTAKDKKTVSQNSDVRIETLYERTCQNTTYYSVVDDIWEVHYGSNIQIPIFQCRWIKHPKGVEVDGYGLMMVDLNNVGYKDNTWVLASQVAQVLYIADPTKKTKHVVIPEKQDIIGVDGISDMEEYNQYEEINLFTDLTQKMRTIEASIRKDDKLRASKDGETRIVTA